MVDRVVMVEPWSYDGELKQGDQAVVLVTHDR